MFCFCLDLLQCFLWCLIWSEFFRKSDCKIKARIKPNAFQRFASSDYLNSGEEIFFFWGNKTILEMNNLFFERSSLSSLFFFFWHFFSLSWGVWSQGVKWWLIFSYLVCKVHALVEEVMHKTFCFYYCRRLMNIMSIILKCTISSVNFLSCKLIKLFWPVQ